MATVDVGIRVSGLDVDEPDVEAVLSEKYPLVLVSGVHPCVLTITVDASRVVTDVVSLMRAMQMDFPEMRIHGVDRDLVGITDIAHRVGVSREGARKWTRSEGFPEPFDFLQAASMPIWAWTEVSSWLERERSVDLDETLPTLQTLTQLENCLMRNPDHTTVEWHQLRQASKIEQPRIQATVWRVSAGGRAQRTDSTLGSVDAAAAIETTRLTGLVAVDSH
jgi:hypothetical protein